MPDTHHPDRDVSVTVTTLSFCSNLLKQCIIRSGKWVTEVEVRLNGCIDLVAAEAIYHKEGHTRSVLNWPSPQDVPKIKGCPKDVGMLKWFNALCI